MRFLLPLFLLVNITSFCQSLKQKEGRSFGIGVQAFEPTGLTFQSFKGFFNDNNSSLATYGVWELGVGMENITGVVDDKLYSGGDWTKGGFRVDVNYLYPLITIYSPFVFQTYLGGGLQTGTREYRTDEGIQSDFSTGANLMVRIELVTHGIDLGRDVWFLSIYGDIKYHKAFSESFDYVSPVVGVRMRKGR